MDGTARHDIFAVADVNRGVLFRLGFVRFKLDKTTGGQFVELLIELEFQFVDVFVDGIKMPERIQLLLKRPQALQILSVGTAGADLGIFEIGKDKRLVGGLELPEGRLELFFGVFPDLGAKQHYEQVTVPNGLVVLVLQPGLGNRVEKIFPEVEVKKNTLISPILVLAIDEDLKLFPILFQFQGGGQK